MKRKFEFNKCNNLTYLGVFDKYNYIFNPREMLIFDNLLLITSYGDNCIYIYNSMSNELINKVKTPNLSNPRGIFLYKEKIYVTCFGDPIGKVVCLDSKNFTEIFYFSTPRPRGIILFQNKMYITSVLESKINIYNLEGNYYQSFESEYLKNPRGITLNNLRSVSLFILNTIIVNKFKKLINYIFFY